MTSRLQPENEKLWKQTLRDLPKFLAGKPSSFRRVELPIAATSKEIKAARKSIHATQKKFASVVGVSVETVKAWESGRRSPEGPASKVIRMIRNDASFAQRLEAA